MFYLNWKDNCKIYKNQFKYWILTLIYGDMMAQSWNFMQKFIEISV
jgi:hypothetical protein